LTLQDLNAMIAEKVTSKILEKIKDNILYVFLFGCNTLFAVMLGTYLSRKEFFILSSFFKAHENMVLFNVKESTILLYQAKLELTSWIKSNRM
jgi:hypothetical protein